MRLDQLDVFTVQAEGLKFAVRLNWGEFRKLVEVSTKARAKANDGDGDANDDTDDALAEMTETLRGHIIGVEGLTEDDGAGGERAVAWQPDMVYRLSPRIVQAVFSQILRPGAQRQAGDPLA
jgi:hypothetical protein